jgi:hypothetical protein
MLAVDIAGYTRADRDNDIRLYLRRSLYQILQDAFQGSGLPWAECHHEDRGDGVLIIIPPRIPGYLVIPHPSLVDPALFRPLNTRVKKTPVHGWIYVPGYQPP